MLANLFASHAAPRHGASFFKRDSKDCATKCWSH